MTANIERVLATPAALAFIGELLQVRFVVEERLPVEARSVLVLGRRPRRRA